MERWFLTVESNCCDPSREKDFSDWYNNIHLPDILEIPGFMHAAFYENTNTSEGQSKFLAIYEIETDDLAGTMTKFEEVVNARGKQGRMSDLGVAVGGGLYRQAGAPAKKKRKKK